VSGSLDIHPDRGHNHGRDRGSVLDPPDRLSEILFGVIMALTFTGAIHAGSDGREEIRTMLFGAIGCNLAWGIVDAVMFILTDLTARNRSFACLRELRRARSTEEAHRIIGDALPPGIAPVMQAEDLEIARRWFDRLPEPPPRAPITAGVLRGALAVFLLVSLSTFPLVIPFLVLRDPTTALRASHAVALAMLFCIGAAFGRYAGQHPWRIGLWMVGIGVVLVLITIALGG
jgi:hypothetical protein